MSVLLDLAARVEALSGPDREVDCLIWCALNDITDIRYPEHAQQFSKSGRVEGRTADGRFKLLGWIDPGKEQRNWSPYGGDDAYPAYTASLDAAITLLPEGMGLRIERYWTARNEDAVWSAEISTGGLPDNPRRVFECFDAATPALALTAAALRAKAGQP